MFSFNISMFLMLFIILFCFCICRVFCVIGIQDIEVLDGYMEDATKFMHNQPIFDGITLVVPNQPVPQLASPHLLSHMQWPAYQPVFRSRIVPQNRGKYRNPMNSKFRINSHSTKRKKKFHNYNDRRNRNKSVFPNSINDALRGEEPEEPVQEQDEQDEEPDIEEEGYDGREEENKDNLFHGHYNNNFKSYYDSLPPFAPKDRHPMITEKTKSFENSDQNKKQPQSLTNSSPLHSPNFDSGRVRTSKTNSNDNLEKPLPLFDRSPPHLTPNQLIDDNYREGDKKQRITTSNQLIPNQNDNHSIKPIQNDDKTAPNNKLKELMGEDLSSNDDPNHFPHQYAIEIRWKNKNNKFYDLEAPEGDVGDREMHSSKDFEHSKHRLYKHEEEEHWHEKKWLNEGLRKAYLNGRPLPFNIVKPNLKLEGNHDYNPLPLYAQPMPTGATLDQINQHFAIPTPNFRVNNRFMDWTKSAINLRSPIVGKFIPIFG